MLHFPRSPNCFSQALTAALFFCFVAKSQSQQADGFTLQQRPGIVLVKPQPWSKESDATVMEFEAFIDRTASGAAGAGYYEFHTKQGTKRQVTTSKVVKLVVFPDPKLITDVVNSTDRQTLEAAITDIKGIIARFPATKTYVEPSLKIVSAEAAQYDAGRVKFEGAWITREAYIKAQAANLLSLLKAEIIRANPPGSFDLEHDPKYLALVEFSAKDPAIKTSTAEVATMHGKIVRTEKRKALLTQLANPGLPMAQATEAVSQLKAVKPEEDPRSAAFVKAWDGGIVTVKEITEQGAKLATALEGEMTAVKTEDVPPQLSPALDTEVSALNEKTTLFLASKPPVQFVTQCKQALAVCATAGDFKKLAGVFQEKQFHNAKDMLDNLSRQSGNIGPETSRVIVGLQGFTATKIDEFTRLREEAKLLDGSGKAAEALVKYEDAYSVIPDASVGEEIARLKPAATPAPSPAK